MKHILQQEREREKESDGETRHQNICADRRQCVASVGNLDNFADVLLLRELLIIESRRQWAKGR